MPPTSIPVALAAVAAALAVAAPAQAIPNDPSPAMIDNSLRLCRIIGAAADPVGGVAQAIVWMEEAALPVDEASQTLQLAVGVYCPAHIPAMRALYTSLTRAPEAGAEALLDGNTIPGYSPRLPG